MVEYLDGWCICDMGMGPEDEKELPMEIIHINSLRPWTNVKSVGAKNENR